MSIIMVFRIALKALGRNKMRTALTMLGMIIGVSAVIALMSVGKGAEASVTSRIQGMGTNLLFVRPAPVETGGGFQGEALTLVDTDAEAIDDPGRFPYIDGVTAQTITFTANFSYRGKVVRAPATGVNPNYQYVREFYVQNGNFITEDFQFLFHHVDRHLVILDQEYLFSHRDLHV